jgi:DNA-binding phage protein
MTPLNELLIQAMEIAQRREPGLSEGKIADRAGVDRGTLSRAKRACGIPTLAAILDALDLDIALVEKRGPRKKRA